MSLLAKIFGDANRKTLRQLEPLVQQINDLEKKVRRFSDADFPAWTTKLKARLKSGEALDKLLPYAFAICREAARRTLDERPYDVQLMAGIVLHQGKIAEQKTGEGKTLSATLPVYLNALAGKGVHIVTVNDYLARRDTEWMGVIYDFLGLTVGCIQHERALQYQRPSQKEQTYQQIEMGDAQNLALAPITRQQAYACDVTYGTNNEFGFDYLRDNMVFTQAQCVQRPLHYAIVDEIDSILIDEARTPLIISAPDVDSAKEYQEFARIVPHLHENEDYNVDEKLQAATLTEQGISRLEKILKVQNIYEEKGITTVHHIEQALRAQTLFRRDRDYVVRDGEVIIVDQFTGRLMPGRRYAGGLHQAIEAKEGVRVQQESKTLGTITFQNYFRLYRKLSGMTGTAATSAEEFSKVYHLDVVVIPTNKEMIRQDLPDVVYKSEAGKFQAVAAEIKRLHEKGQPVLVGTISIEKNEILSGMLARSRVPHEVLNAKNHEREAKIIARAGQKGAVTIATNMAGRGTDIKLGPGVKELGGLHVLGTERHEARRIDNQLRGRAGRQGDPGSSQFFVSLEDDLMRIFGGERVKALMDRLHLPEDQPVQNKILTRSLEAAQAKVEGNNFDIRKHLVEYDDVLNKQREVFYKKRREFLEDGPTLKKAILRMLEEEMENIVVSHTMGEKEDHWDLREIGENVLAIFPQTILSRVTIQSLCKNLEVLAKKGAVGESRARTAVIDYLYALALEIHKKREKELTLPVMRQVEKAVALRVADALWVEHLDAMEDLREGVRLRAYGQKDPLVEYKREGYEQFQRLLEKMKTDIVNTLFKVSVMMPKIASVPPSEDLKLQGASQEYGGVADAAGLSRGGLPNPAAQRPTQDLAARPKVGRNDPCPCGSGKKYKRCHGA